ncbi:tyrosine-type recombinase/integrase [Bacillus altitudinis]|uniref:tyrosine-type recombinase/integrase n=1 Tax=Bacillus altitudinis TaxID=293387 RepID=UPI0039BF8C0A
MPNGFSKYLEKFENMSPSTIESYIRVIATLNSYLSKTYKTSDLHPSEITHTDLINFIKSKDEEGFSTKTINKNISIIKKYFDYLDRFNFIPLDIAAKLKRKKLNLDDHKALNHSYEDLQKVKRAVLHNTEYSTKRILIFLLAMEGLFPADFHFYRSNVIFENERSIIKDAEGKTMISWGKEETNILYLYMWETSYIESEYVLFTKKRSSRLYGPIEQDNISKHLNIVCKDYDLPKLSLYDIRSYMADHYYNELGLPIQEIANRLRIKKASAAALVETSALKFRKHLEIKKNLV